jgi:hypothetical protein
LWFGNQIVSAESVAADKIGRIGLTSVNSNAIGNPFMLDVLNRISKLSPEKLAILSLRLRQEKLQRHSPIARRGDRSQPVAVSFAQERLWFVHQVEPDNLAYHIVGVVGLSGSLDVPSLRGAVKEIVGRHETLRTTFVEVDGKPLQVVSKDSTVEVENDVLESGEPAFIDSWIRRKLQKPFDLVHGPLLRVCLGRIDRDWHILLTVIHHIVSDGPSMNLYFQELIEIYRNFHEQRGHELPEAAIQYSDFSIWQRELLTEAVLNDELAYWKKQLQGIVDLPALPADHPRSQAADQQLASQSTEVPAALVELFKTLLVQQQATPFIGFLAAFQVVLHHYTGFTDIVIGSPVTGRTRVELERVVGLFANLHILRTDLSGDPAFPEILKRTRRVVMEAQDHHEMPFQRLIEELQPARKAGQMPLFQTSFTFFSDFEQIPQVPGLSVIPLKHKSADAMYDLDLNLIQRQGVLTATLEYKQALFDAGTIAALLRSLNLAITAITHKSNVRLSELCELLTKAEEDRALATVKEREEKRRAKIGTTGRKVLHLQSQKRSTI